MTNVCGRPNHDSATIGSYCPTCQADYRDRAYVAEAELNNLRRLIAQDDGECDCETQEQHDSHESQRSIEPTQ